MSKEKAKAEIGFFEKYLTIWVILCMVPVMLTLVKIANKTPHWFPQLKAENQ